MQTDFLIHTLIVVFPLVRLLDNRAHNIIGNPGVGEISVNTVDLMVGDVPPVPNSSRNRIDQISEINLREERVDFSYPEHSVQGK